MKRFYLIFITIIALSNLALTPAERKIVEHAQTNLHLAQDQLKAANQEVILADQRAQAAEQKASEADQHAKDTDAKAALVKKEIQVAHDNEQRLANENAKMKPLYDRVRGPWWAPGLGAIIYGVERLSVHMLILAGILIVLGLIAWLLSVTVAPWLKPFFALLKGFCNSLANWITNLFKKKQP